MSDEWAVGQWVTCEAVNGWAFRGKVTKIRKHRGKVEYTLQGLPDTEVITYPYCLLDEEEQP